jgi:hypothetical protein
MSTVNIQLDSESMHIIEMQAPNHLPVRMILAYYSNAEIPEISFLPRSNQELKINAMHNEENFLTDHASFEVAPHFDEKTGDFIPSFPIPTNGQNLVLRKYCSLTNLTLSHKRISQATGIIDVDALQKIEDQLRETNKTKFDDMSVAEFRLEARIANERCQYKRLTPESLD